MSNVIDSIRLSGVTYQIQGEGGTPTVELTQAQYDALVTAGTVSDDTYYIITDAQAGDLTNYYTKTETNTLLGGKADTATTYTKTEVDTALASKQTTLTAGTNITIVDNVISAEGGSDINVVQTTGTSTTDVMSQDAVTTAINTVSGAIPSTYISAISKDAVQGWMRFVRFSTPSNFNYFLLDNPKINGTPIHKFTGVESQINQFSLVETSAITTSISSSSTDSQVPSAKAVNDKLGGLSLVKLTQSAYDALTTKNNNTLYVIVN